MSSNSSILLVFAQEGSSKCEFPDIWSETRGRRGRILGSLEGFSAPKGLLQA